MEREERILSEIEKTIASLDQQPTLEGNPFLFTRIRAVLESGGRTHLHPTRNRLRIWYLALSLLILFNLVSVLEVLSSRPVASSRQDLVTSLSNEYNMDDIGSTRGN